jgi:hypothetical protein
VQLRQTSAFKIAVSHYPAVNFQEQQIYPNFKSAHFLPVGVFQGSHFLLFLDLLTPHTEFISLAAVLGLYLTCAGPLFALYLREQHQTRI